MQPLKRILREHGHGSQAELARRLKMGETHISKYANGLIPGPKTQERIAKKLSDLTGKEIEVETLWPK